MGTEPEDELSRIRQESIDRLDAGRLPLEAEKRLQDIRGRPNFFTSDLSVSEFALGQSLGVRPISQVMGSCVYHAALQAGGRTRTYRPANLARPWNAARTSALKRLAMEAKLCGKSWTRQAGSSPRSKKRRRNSPKIGPKVWALARCTRRRQAGFRYIH